MSRCSLCPGKNTCIPPDGPQSDVEFIGEAPGFDENRSGVPFIGKTGREVNEHYMPCAGLQRPNVLVDNAISCLPDRPKGKLDMSKKADRALLTACAEHHLYSRWQVNPPKVIVAMGAFACYAVDPDIDLEIHHGIPISTKWGVCFPMYHPAGGIHEPKKMLQIRTDWIRLRRFLRGTLVINNDQYPQPDYAEVTDVDEINSLCPTIPMACDTESSRKSGPYCLTYSQSPGTGRLIRADRRDLLDAFQAQLNKWASIILFHNWLYDWTVTEDMGLAFPYKAMRDTMVTVYHLANMPQGLKNLAYRLLGMEMQSFDDLVRPYSTQKVLQYYKAAQQQQWIKPDEQVVRDSKTGKWKLYKPQSMSTKFKRFFTDYGKNEDKDVFKMFEENWLDYQAEIEAKCGPYPGMDITHVPFEKILFYACRDSDATLRLWPILQKMKKAAQAGKLQEQWDL